MKWRNFFTNNTWWGKFLGACFGYLIAGSAGALLGLLIGNLFDRGLMTHFNVAHPSYHDEVNQKIQAIFLETTFTIMGHMAKMDGRVSEAEIAMARHIMQEMRLTTTQKKKAKQFFNLGKTLYNPQTQLMLFYQTCRYNSALVKLFLDIQYRFAQVDTLTPSKINLLNHLFRQMGYAPIYEQQRYQRDNTRQSYQESAYQQHTTSPNTSPSLTDACRILNITPEASMREIKQAYRRLISQHHPDKLVARKAPQHEIKAANEKTQQITKAYDKICQYKLGK